MTARKSLAKTNPMQHGRGIRTAAVHSRASIPYFMRPVFRILDLFCGAGGATGAVKEAAERMGYRVEIVAINHWEVAVETWRHNYEKRFPGCVVKCCGVDDIRDPRVLFDGKKVDAVIGGPECIEFSTAAGGKPTNYQYRPTPWCMVRFTEALNPEIVLIENVKEFKKKWPPYNAMIAAFEAMGYSVSDTVLCAADFGDPTTRERMFIQCVRNRKVCWPQPTHSSDGRDNLFGLKPWVPAFDIIDWEKKGQWLDEMPGKKQYGGLPLSPKTLWRILSGFKEAGLYPVVAEWDNQSSKRAGRSTKLPLSTITGKARHGVAEPFMVKLRGTGKTASIKKPFPTITSGGMHLALAEPLLIHTAHAGKRRARKVSEPMPTITGQRGDLALLEFVLPQGGGGKLRPINKPIPTVQCDGAIALVEAFIVKYYGTAKTCSIRKPLPTVTTKDRFALVCPEVVFSDGSTARIRVRWRMLNWHELAAAQGFAKDHVFCGSRTRRNKIISIEPGINHGDIVAQIGNAWPHNLGRAIMLAILSQRSDIRNLLEEVAA